jgi:TnpA family transposase
MPVQFLSEADYARLNRFPEEIPTEDCFTFFLVNHDDLTEINKQRSNSSRLGFALQICALRYMGFVPQDLKSAPDRVVRYVAEQLQVSTDVLDSYGTRTRKEHLRFSRMHVGFRLATKLDLLSLEQWLLDRALEHDKPTLLFNMACDHLRQQQIVRLGTARIAQKVSKARNRAQKVTYKVLKPLLTKEHSNFFDNLLEVDDTLKRTYLSWLQRTPTGHNLGQMLETLEKIAFLQKQGVAHWDLSAINPNRVKLLAKCKMT